MVPLTGAINILKAATKQFPALRYAWGLIGLSAAAAIAIRLNGDGKAAVIAGSLTLVGFVLVMIVSTVSKSANLVRLPAILLTWAITIFFIVFLVFTILAYAASWPCNWMVFLDIKSAECSSGTFESGALHNDRLAPQEGPVRKLRLSFQKEKRDSAELARAVGILRAEYGSAQTRVQDFEFVHLAGSVAKDDLVVIFSIKNAEDTDLYISVFAAKERKYDLILSEKILSFPEIFLVNEGTNTYLVMATYDGSRGFMTASVYRRLSAGNFKKLADKFDTHYNKWIGMLADGLYLFSGKERFRIVFKGDTISFKRDVVTPGDLGSAAHELVFLNKKLTYDGMLVDVSKPIVIGQAERIILKHTEDERVLAASDVLTWVNSPAGRILKPVAKGEGDVMFPDSDVTVTIQVQ